MFNLTFLEALIHPEFKSFLVCSHLVGLFLHEFSFRGKDLFVPSIVVLFSLLLFKFMNATLHLMCLLIVLLLGQVLLDSLKVEQLSTSFKGVWFFLQCPSIVFKLFGMSFVHGVELILVCF